MMTMQEKVLSNIEKIVTKFGFEVIDVPNYSNCGMLSIQRPDEIGEVGHVSYMFDSGTMELSITIGGRKLTSQPPREGYFNYYMTYEQSGKEYPVFRDRLENALKRVKKYK